ncbi:MAG: archease [Candidatus Omnitrophota bacterium]|nr:archease [Candidatus Omnitrophota bacterium]
MKSYELIEHTADIGIRVKGKDLKQLFKNAALAMFEIIGERKNKELPGQETIAIEQSAQGLDELFVNWLNELLSLSATKELIFSDFQIKNLDQHRLQAVAAGSSIKNYRINTEIKAATYHQLKIERSKGGWVAEVIFDV